jgi:hypothetical protein
MIHIQRTFSPVKFTITEPQDVRYLLVALQSSLRTMEERWFGLRTRDVPEKDQEYYNTIKYFVKQLQNIPTQMELT